MHGPASVRPSGHPGIPVASEWQYIGREPLLAAYRTSFVLWRIDAMALAEDPPFGGLWCDQPAPFYVPGGTNFPGGSRKRYPRDVGLRVLADAVGQAADHRHKSVEINRLGNV
jgi:hypothetical protein